MSNRTARYPVRARAVRGGLLTVCGTALATSAHAAGGGGLPDAGSTMLFTALIGLAATALADRARGPLRLLVVLGLAQLVMHLVLCGHGMHEAMPHTPDFDGTAMTATHVVATLLTALLLARADTLVAGARAGLRRLLPRSWRDAPVPDHAPSRVLRAPVQVSILLSVLLPRVHQRRGPPAFS